jgi:hypothetical protein
MHQKLLLFFCCCVAFIWGCGVHEIISLRRRREVRRIREASARLMRARPPEILEPIRLAAIGQGIR